MFHCALVEHNNVFEFIDHHMFTVCIDL